ncbi:hypothetical protein [Rhizobium aegyptiacum]|uniref:hypothetical protein n=1 Tax=Rhizobium aegyptiacum TaxID=1764550 RepID=UPI0012E7805F|nr:hypothetical protein [Rhizobium aegyptiacum]
MPFGELSLFCRNRPVMQAAVKADGDVENKDIVLAPRAALGTGDEPRADFEVLGQKQEALHDALQADLISILILIAAAYLLCTWYQGEQVETADGLFVLRREPWCLWVGLPLLAWSFLGRSPYFCCSPGAVAFPCGPRATKG